MKERPLTSSPLTCAMQPSQHSTTIDTICPQHGSYTATVRVLDCGAGFTPVTTTSRCPQCADEERKSRELRQKAAHEEQRAQRVGDLLRQSGIPARFMGRTFEHFAATEQRQKLALSVCRAYASKWAEKRKQGASLVLTGSPGTGKTHLACAIGSAVITQHLNPVLFCSASTMMRSIKQTYSKDSQIDEQEVIDEFAGVSLLIVDEVGVQIGSGCEKFLMFEIFNERYQSMRPTILISNLSTGELEKYLGERIMDRYRECGSVLAFNWSSHRGQQYGTPA